MPGSGISFGGMAVLQIQALKKSFRAPDGSTLAVIDIPEFSLQSGEQMALAGPSGSGKTTFLHLIAGILTPDSGSIRVDNTEIAGMPEHRRDRVRAHCIGYIFQSFNLLQGFTCLENVLLGMAFGVGADPAQAEGLLRRVGLGDRLHHFPRQLSTGQQQRVAVARALAGKPKLVLADEPTGNLDPINARQSLALIRETCRETGAALLLVSHDRDILADFTQVPSLSDLNRAAQHREARV
jgi:ABC-type lipoprotein export system ATPase subunit